MVKSQSPLDVVDLFFVEQRKLETDFALFLVARRHAQFLVVDGKQLFMLASRNV